MRAAGKDRCTAQERSLERGERERELGEGERERDTLRKIESQWAFIHER